jgi:molybdopterin synthase catalytic subunit
MTMHWAEAVRQTGVAQRRIDAERTARRYADGHAIVVFRGQVREAKPQEVEGFLDWEPVTEAPAPEAGGCGP